MRSGSVIFLLECLPQLAAVGCLIVSLLPELIRMPAESYTPLSIHREAGHGVTQRSWSIRCNNLAKVVAPCIAYVLGVLRPIGKNASPGCQVVGPLAGQ